MRMVGRRFGTGRGRGRSRSPGLTIPELAVVLVLGIVILATIMEWCRLMMTRAAVVHAAREGARRAVVARGELTTAQLRDYIDARIPDAPRAIADYDKATSIAIERIGPTGNVIGGGADAWREARRDDRIAVEIRGTYKPILGIGWGVGQVKLRAAAAMYAEID